MTAATTPFLELLRCPTCGARVEGDGPLDCTGCGAAYPVEDDIPRMLDERAPGVAEKRYALGQNPHGSVSLLVEQGGAVKAAYGYTPYGLEDDELSSGDAASNPVNSYRYSGKRFDSGSGTINMGARHFSPSTGRFLQVDTYASAVRNLGLSGSTLTGNRYSLAGGNPIGYVEADGHGVYSVSAPHTPDGESMDYWKSLGESERTPAPPPSPPVDAEPASTPAPESPRALMSPAQQIADGGGSCVMAYIPCYLPRNHNVSEAICGTNGCKAWKDSAVEWIDEHKTEIAINAGLLAVALIIPVAGPAILATRAGLAARAAAQKSTLVAVVVSVKILSRVNLDQSTVESLADCLGEVATVLHGGGRGGFIDCAEFVFSVPRIKTRGK